MEPGMAYTYPNSHYAHLGERMSPLVPDRVCELSVECCHLRNRISDKEEQINKLESLVKRMEITVKRSNNSFKSATHLNKTLEAEKAKLEAEVIESQKKLLKAESMINFQARVIEKNRRVIEKLKAPASTESTCGPKIKKNVAQVLKENADLKNMVEKLNEELSDAKSANEDKKIKLNTFEKKTDQLLDQINSLQKKLHIVQGDLRSEKAAVTQLQEKSQQEDMGELSYTNAFIDLEEAYEELHTKYELLWAERSSLADSLSCMRHERNHIYAAAKKAGIRIDALLSERENESAENLPLD